MVDLILGIFLGIIITLVVLIIIARISIWVDTVNKKLTILEQFLEMQAELNKMFKVMKEYKEVQND